MGPKSSSSKKRARSTGDATSSSSAETAESSRTKLRRIHFEAMAALLREEKGPDDIELSEECEEVRDEWMKKWSNSMINQLEALVDDEEGEPDPDAYANADPKQLQRLDTLKASVAVVYERVQRLRAKVLGKGARMWAGHLEETRPEDPEEPEEPPNVREVVAEADITAMRKSANNTGNVYQQKKTEISESLQELARTVNAADTSLGMHSTAEEIMSAAANGGSSSSSSSSVSVGLDVQAGGGSKFLGHMQGGRGR